MPIRVLLNGQTREFEELAPPVSMTQLIAELQLKGDRIAVELNGAIAARSGGSVPATSNCEMPEYEMPTMPTLWCRTQDWAPTVWIMS